MPMNFDDLADYGKISDTWASRSCVGTCGENVKQTNAYRAYVKKQCNDQKYSKNAITAFINTTGTTNIFLIYIV